MELTFGMKIRIALSMAVGVGLIGILSWPLVGPLEPYDVVSFINGQISANDVILLLAISFGTGLLAYVVSWPYGSRIGVLAVPAGLAVWAMRSGAIGTLMQVNTSITKREEIFTVLHWEAFLWLAMVAAGYLSTHLLREPKIGAATEPRKLNKGAFINPVLAIVGTAVIVPIIISIFARDFTLWDDKIGTAMGQPANGQIAFSVIVAFGVAGFLVKKFLELDYILPLIASCLITPVAISIYGKPGTLEFYADYWPPVFFPNSVLAVLPVQIVSFGTIGAIAGYWLAIRYNYWRLNEANSE